MKQFEMTQTGSEIRVGSLCLALTVLVLFLCTQVSAEGLDDSVISSGTEKSLDFQIAASSPIPFISGYSVGIEVTAGVEVVRRLSLDVAYRKQLADYAMNATDKNVMRTQVGYWGLRKDRRVKERGWYTRKGILLGHQVSAGPQTVNEENIRFEKHHFITAGIAYRATHWWQRHFGFIFQMAVVGGVSIHTYRTVDWNGKMPSCHVVIRNRFDFADSLFAGVQFHVGIAF